ncbi:hypothetical protein LX36DRAFT_290576 [Colletotrichum falcatum]|nr:hypothetical protein LX36DRAFT_290576 [Colletotrichum falcatum]
MKAPGLGTPRLPELSSDLERPAQRRLSWLHSLKISLNIAKLLVNLDVVCSAQQNCQHPSESSIHRGQLRIRSIYPYKTRGPSWLPADNGGGDMLASFQRREMSGPSTIFQIMLPPTNQPTNQPKQASKAQCRGASRRAGEPVRPTSVPGFIALILVRPDARQWHHCLGGTCSLS